MFDQLTDKFTDAIQSLSGKGTITEKNIEDALKDVRTALLEADVNFKVVKNFIGDVKEEALGEKVLRGVNPGDQFTKIVQDKLAHLMGEENKEVDLDRSGILPIVVVGLNGQGKTTFCGKLSLHLTKKKNKKVLLVPADNFRPAAKDQLITLPREWRLITLIVIYQPHRPKFQKLPWTMQKVIITMSPLSIRQDVCMLTMSSWDSFRTYEMK